MTNDKDLKLDEMWQKRVPYDTRQLALKQLAGNMKTNFTLLKRKHIKYFKMSMKTKKDISQVCFINKKAFNTETLCLFPRRLKNPISLKKQRTMKRWKKEIKETCDFIISKECGNYYFCIPQKHEDTKVIPATYDITSLDPGVRSFQTFYSDEMVAGKLGDNTCHQLFLLHRSIDKLKSKRTKSGSKKTRFNLKRRCSLLRTKIKNIVADLHWKTANFLCVSYGTILLPSFGIKGMSQKKQRKINRKTTRNLLSLSHYKFKERLKYMSSVYNRQLYIVGEEYTTQTCGGCGNRKKMGGSKRYMCKNCGFSLDRDYNGARNILLKHLVPSNESRVAGSSHLEFSKPEGC